MVDETHKEYDEMLPENDGSISDIIPDTPETILIAGQSETMSNDIAAMLNEKYNTNCLSVTHQELLTLFLENPIKYSTLIMSVDGEVPENFSDTEKETADGGLQTGMVILDKIRKGKVSEHSRIPIILYTLKELDITLDNKTHIARGPDILRDIDDKLVTIDIRKDQIHMGLICMPGDDLPETEQ